MPGGAEIREVEVHIELERRLHRVGALRRYVGRHGRDVLAFPYAGEWIDNPEGFALDPALPLTPGVFPVTRRGRISGALSDAMPDDTWGRQLMQRRRRRVAAPKRGRMTALTELDYLLGITDAVRHGALRFRLSGADDFEAKSQSGAPPVTFLRRLAHAVYRIDRGEESVADLRLLLAPGSSLGGARPKAAVVDAQGRLTIAKFPKTTDDYSLETWEEVALRLAERAGIEAPPHRLVRVDGRPVLLSQRFDRRGSARIPFLSAMSLTGGTDGEPGSYPEIADGIARHGADARADSIALYRRMLFNVLVSNVDDHLRNHGFLRLGPCGWSLSPVYDLNPTPSDLKARVLTTRIDLNDGTCSLDLALGAAEYLGVALTAARKIAREVAEAVQGWRIAARSVGATRSDIDRMASAFEHEDLARALVL